MGRCTGCGKQAGFMMSACTSCLAEEEQADRREAAARAAARSGGTAATSPAVAKPRAPDPDLSNISRRQSALHTAASAEGERRDHVETTAGLTVAGAVSMAIGLWLLLVAPSAGDPVDLLGESIRVVNVHRLTLGETLTIVGAIFLGFAWRPR